MNHEGIGMELMICQKLVNLNHGQIFVHSDGENQGARFSFTMRMKLPEYVEECAAMVVQGETGSVLLDH